MIDGGTISFSPNMKSDRLNLWLLQECGEYHKESIDKLKRKPCMHVMMHNYSLDVKLLK